MIGYSAEPFYWLEGVSVWPSQLLRIVVILLAIGFFRWGKNRLEKMQDDLQNNKGETSTFQLSPILSANQTNYSCWDLLFIGNWKSENNQRETVSPDNLWGSYLVYRKQTIKGYSAVLARVILHGLTFFLFAFVFINLSGSPNAPVRGDSAYIINSVMIFLSVTVTILLTMWVVDNALLCERLISYLSEKPSQWNESARNWAIRKNHVASKCVEDWLDIQLVIRMTATIQNLIWGPMVCVSLLVMARSPIIDDWDIPWGLGLVFICMLVYAIYAEVLLQRGAKRARIKAINQLTAKLIKARFNTKHPNDSVAKRIEAEIEDLHSLRNGAFRPWYEWPLLQSFGGLGTVVVALQYFAEFWRDGRF